MILCHGNVHLSARKYFFDVSCGKVASHARTTSVIVIQYCNCTVQYCTVQYLYVQYLYAEAKNRLYSFSAVQYAKQEALLVKNCHRYGTSIRHNADIIF